MLRRPGDAFEHPAETITKHAPPTVDAKKKWDQAFSLAKETGRRVWAINGGRYCGPCIRFSRWIDEHGDVLEQDYVYVKVDTFLDEHGSEVAERITRGGLHGVPFHAVFDSGGEVLIDSDGPTGNIGMPGGFEGVRHLGEMLDATRRKISADEVERLLESLR